MFGRSNCIDRLEEAFIRSQSLLERLVNVQERQQTTLERHEGNFERILQLINQSNQRIDQVYEEIKGLRTESLRLQRHFFGEDNNPDGNG